jgi:predicted GNAT family acetyltransferase
MNYDNTLLKINDDDHHIEMDVEGHTAFIDYKLSGDVLKLIHTEVPEELEGKGVGTAIVTKALQYARDNNLKVIPICPFVQAFLKRHPEWDFIVQHSH